MADTTAVRPSGWKSERGRLRYVAAYHAAMERWPVPYESRLVATRFGITHVVTSGSAGPPLVMLHAATGFGATQWYPNVGALSERYRVFAVDYIGSAGLGTQTHPMFSREDCRDWLLDLFDELGLERPALVGSSQGGWLALNLAILSPDRVGPLALLAPAASILPFRRAMRLMISAGPYMPAWTGPPSIKALFGGRVEVDERLVEVLTLHLAFFRYQRQAPFPHAFDDRELAGIRSPTLLMIGDREVIYPPRAALSRAQVLIPEVETELVENTGHLINIEQAGLTDRRLSAFLAAHAGIDVSGRSGSAVPS
ncbi:MAG TPA: alpha/beta hydrolase [Acidimicrobiia bacterium]